MREREKSKLIKIIKASGCTLAAVSSSLLFPTGLYLIGHGIVEADAPEICYGVLSASAGTGISLGFGYAALNYYKSLRQRETN